MNLDPYPENPDESNEGTYFDYQAREFEIVHVSGFDYIIEFTKSETNVISDAIPIQGDTLKIEYDSESSEIRLLKNSVKELQMDLQPFLLELKHFKRDYYMPSKKMERVVENDSYYLKAYFTRIEGNFESSGPKIYYFSSRLFLKLK